MEKGEPFILLVCMCLVAQSCLTLCDLMDCSLPGSSVHGNSPGKKTGVGGHALLQGIFPTQGSNPGLPHCRWILYCLSHQGSLDSGNVNWYSQYGEQYGGSLKKLKVELPHDLAIPVLGIHLEKTVIQKVYNSQDMEAT